MTDDTTPISDTLERLERAEQLKLIGEHHSALEMLEQLLIEDPENISALEEVADNELSLEQFERAEIAALRTVALDKESYTGHYILGFLRSTTGDWEDAANHLRKANASRSNNAEILRCLGWALFNTGQRAQGIVTLERALNLDNENALTLCDLGVTYLQTRNFPKAKALFERALNLDPDNPKAVECIQAMGKIEEAMKK
jgi:Flp pilus assembly protein TadD